MFNKRSSGILLHITSLPGGTLGEEAFTFAKKLCSAGQRFWQILPVNPVGTDFSPYCSPAVFAGGEHILDKSVSHDDERAFSDFREKESGWLSDYAIFTALKRRDPRPFWQWDERYKNRDIGSLMAFALSNEREITEIKRAQFEFSCQWAELKKYANDLGVFIIGDLPFYPARDSADVWANTGYFDLSLSAGCPPDGFTDDGQLWGNAVYRFDSMEKDGFKWWVERFRRAADLFDAVRVDHFRGFESFYAVPEGETPAGGRWIKAPGDRLFKKVKEALPGLSLIAEDLGYITDEVHTLINDCGLPGTRVLQFAFGENMDSMYLPHYLERNSVIYTGTHDNDTSNGWFKSLDEKSRALFSAYAGKSASESAAEAMMRLAYSSVSNTAVIPMQDALDLTDARMNTPGTVGGKNWRWSMKKGAFDAEVIKKLKKSAFLYGRG